MNQDQVRSFLERYFNAHNALFTKVHPAYFQVQLPVEVDKDLGNRPFYWTYVERLNLEPQPMDMTFIFDKSQTPEDVRGEEMMFGSPRLLQFFASARKHGKCVRLFEMPEQENERAGLVPWLGINYRISFICDRKKDVLQSLGINLIHGTIQDHFFAQLEKRTLGSVMPNYSYTIQPIYSIDSAIPLLEAYLSTIIQQEDPIWAMEAKQRLAEELALTESFYTKKEEPDAEQESKSPDYHEKRIEELRWQHDPRIEVEIINGGLFYLLHKKGETT